MTRPNPFLVALVSGVLGALACLATTAVADEPKTITKTVTHNVVKTDPVKNCLYGFMTEYELIDSSGETGYVPSGCRGLTETQMNQVKLVLNNFLDSAIVDAS